MYDKTNMVVNSGCKDDQKVKEYLRVGGNVMKKLREVFEQVNEPFSDTSTKMIHIRKMKRAVDHSNSYV
jgi:hypothetical protein